jgi:hypothetical protein
MIWFPSIEASSHGLIRFSCRRWLTVLATTALRRYQSEFAYKKVKLYMAGFVLQRLVGDGVRLIKIQVYA